MGGFDYFNKPLYISGLFAITDIFLRSKYASLPIKVGTTSLNR